VEFSAVREAVDNVVVAGNKAADKGNRHLTNKDRWDGLNTNSVDFSRTYSDDNLSELTIFTLAPSLARLLRLKEQWQMFALLLTCSVCSHIDCTPKKENSLLKKIFRVHTFPWISSHSYDIVDSRNCAYMQVYCALMKICLIRCIAILLAGCSSYSTMTNIYTMALSYQNGTLTTADMGSTATNLSNTLANFKGGFQLEVRTGYFGMCVRQKGVLWVCSSDFNALLQQIGVESDPLNLIGAAAKFKDSVLFSGLLYVNRHVYAMRYDFVTDLYSGL
jgi:hypothetical protein